MNNSLKITVTTKTKDNKIAHRELPLPLDCDDIKLYGISMECSTEEHHAEHSAELIGNLDVKAVNEFYEKLASMDGEDCILLLNILAHDKFLLIKPDWYMNQVCHAVEDIDNNDWAVYADWEAVGKDMWEGVMLPALEEANVEGSTTDLIYDSLDWGELGIHALSRNVSDECFFKAQDGRVLVYRD